MQIQSQTQTAALDPTQSAAAASTQDPTQTTDPTDAAASSVDGLANESTFLQLLVAQIKNQDPLQPTDGVQFLTQLAQFSQLEQLIGIRQEIGAKAASDPTATPTTDATPAAAATATTTSAITSAINSATTAATTLASI